jgi:hypothetical protein
MLAVAGETLIVTAPAALTVMLAVALFVESCELVAVK